MATRTISIWTSDKFRIPWAVFVEFVQQQANRLTFGSAQYDPQGVGPDRRHKYMTRMKLEVTAYRKSGNREHLLNIANYAWLESQAPENPKFHWDNTVDSVTRGKV